MKEFSGIDNVKSSINAENKPLTLLSRDLSNLIPNISSIGASRKASITSTTVTGRIGGDRKPKAKIEITKSQYSTEDNERLLGVYFTIDLKARRSVSLRAAAEVCINEGNSVEKEAPIKGKAPTFLYWQKPGGVRSGDLKIQCREDEVGEWKVVFSIPDNIQVRVEVDVV